MNTDPLSLSALYDAMSRAYQAKQPEQVDALYAAHYIPAIIAEGFTPKQAQVIEGEAYDRGHSAGLLECVNVTFGLIDFAKRLR